MPTADRPRIVFLIPFASRGVVANWHLTSSYLEQTLRSVFNSTDGSFRVVVAGNEIPDCALPADHRFKFLALEQASQMTTEATYFDRVQDKMKKLERAWDFSKRTWKPQFVMKLDADDFISAKLVGWLASTTDEAGFRLRQGWFWNTDSAFMQFTEAFDDLCGSCLIIRSDVADLTGPFFINSPEEKLRIIDHHSLVPGARTGTVLLNDCHHRAEAQFRYLGLSLAEVPFRAAVYRVASQSGMTMVRMVIENAPPQGGWRIHSLRWLLGRIRRTRPINGALRREFALP